MDSELLAGLSKNDSGTGKQIDASLTPSGSLDVLPAFKALGRELSRRRTRLSGDLQPLASNIIELVDFLKSGQPPAVVLPMLARQVRFWDRRWDQGAR
jgi:hypothetical protein